MEYMYEIRYMIGPNGHLVFEGGSNEQEAIQNLKDRLKSHYKKYEGELNLKIDKISIMGDYKLIMKDLQRNDI